MLLCKKIKLEVSEQDNVYHMGDFKDARWYNKQPNELRSKRDQCKQENNLREYS